MSTEPGPAKWDEQYDLVIVGSGAGSVTAALAARQHGRRALIVEKEDKFGGSTAMSGGVFWVPNHPLMKRAGVADSLERARTYMDAVVGNDAGPAAAPARREAFLRTGPKVIEFLESHGMKFVYADGWSDYYDELPGGEPRGRSVIAELFDINQLGDWQDKLRQFEGFPYPVKSSEFDDLMLVKRTWAGKAMALRLAGRLAWQVVTRKKIRGMGAAIQGRLLQIALREELLIRLNAPVVELVVQGGRVAGIVTRRENQTQRISARCGVLINAGGFSRNAQMRASYQPTPTCRWTNANPGDTGEVMQMAMGLGAAVDLMDNAWWNLTSLGPDGNLPWGASAESLPYRKDSPFMHVMDLSKPFLIMVDGSGQRYVDESASYMEVGRAMYARHASVGAVPSWVIMDSRHRQYYAWGTAPPGVTPKEWLESGYLRRAESIEVLAALCGIEPAALRSTVDRFNSFCRSGVDEDFRRGARAYDRAHGDPTVKPNPNLGPIEKPPFYAVAMHPGDVGTSGGLLCDEHARVLREDGTNIPGLYATGNSTASVFGRVYPGAGASIAASCVFGYVAALDAVSRGRR